MLLTNTRLRLFIPHNLRQLSNTFENREKLILKIIKIFVYNGSRLFVQLKDAHLNYIFSVAFLFNFQADLFCLPRFRQFSFACQTK